MCAFYTEIRQRGVSLGPMGTPVAMAAGGATPLLGPGSTPVGKLAHIHINKN